MATLAAEPRATYIAGGTNVVDITALPLRAITHSFDGVKGIGEIGIVGAAAAVANAVYHATGKRAACRSPREKLLG